MTGASNLTGERITLFDRALVPASNNIKEGYVVVHASATDNQVVDVPSAAAALLGGRAFAGISATQGTINILQDNRVTVAKGGIAKAALKAATACVAGAVAGYNPADGGPVQPVTPANAAVLVPIGRFTQSKASSGAEQFVGLELYAHSADGAERLLSAATASSTAITNTATETAFSVSIPIPANRLLAVGAVLKIRAKARVTVGNANDTLQLKCRLDSAAGVVLGQTPAVDVTNAGGDLAVLDLAATLRTTGASGTLVCDGFGGISPGQAVATGGNVQTTGTAGTVAIDTTVAHTLVITATWSAASASNSVVLEDLLATLLG